MKFLKLFALLLTGYTIGEFFTMWRMQTETYTLKEWTHHYIQGIKDETPRARQIGEELRAGNFEESKAKLKDVMFPNQEK